MKLKYTYLGSSDSYGND